MATSISILRALTDSDALLAHLSDTAGDHDAPSRQFEAATDLVWEGDIDGEICNPLPADEREAARYLAARAMEMAGDSPTADDDSAYDKVYRAWCDIARDYPLVYVKVRDPSDDGIYEYLVGGYPTLDACFAAVDATGHVDSYDIVGTVRFAVVVAGSDAAQCRIDGVWAMVDGCTVPLDFVENALREAGQPEAIVYRGWGSDAVDTGRRIYNRYQVWALVTDVTGDRGTIVETAADPETLRYTASEQAARGYECTAIVALRPDDDDECGERIYMVGRARK